MMPIKIEAAAISHTRILGSKIIKMPTIINTMPGTISRNPDPGVFVIPLHIEAIGHISILLMLIPPLNIERLTSAITRPAYDTKREAPRCITGDLPPIK